MDRVVLRLMVIVLLLGAGCSSSPTSPQTVAPIISSVSALATSASPQSVTVNGSGFESGLTLKISPSTSAPSTISVGQITNVTSTSFQASLAITSGTFTFQANNPGGAASPSFTVVVQLACASPAALTGTYTPAAPGYIVQYVAGTNPNAATATLQAKYGFTASGVLVNVFPGFTAVLTPVMVDGVRCEPAVQGLAYNQLLSAGGGR
jgi:hypothetical protein